MTFYNKFLELCTKNNITPTKALKEMKLSSGVGTCWKNGATPRDTNLKKVCDYFNVSKTYFTENTGEIDDLTAEGITKKFLFGNEPPTETEWNEILNHIKWIKYRRKYTE